MQIFRQLDSVQLGSTACAIGMFDGIHLGHRMVLEQAIRSSAIEELQSVVFTFANHPQTLISKTPTPLLTTLEERIAAFEAFGFDAALILDFTADLQNMAAEDFIQQILLDALHVKAVSVGYDHRFGKNRRGDGSFLQTAGEAHGFQVDIIAPIRQGDQIISSTLIRKLLSYGDLKQANQLLGRPYHLTGATISGVGRGKQIGFPTANLSIATDRLLPAQGVYAGMVQCSGETTLRPAVCNIGLAPTFGDQVQPRIEVHILDYDANLYGKTVTFTFLHRLRPEQTFDSPTALIQQIERDCLAAREFLKQNTPVCHPQL